MPRHTKQTISSLSYYDCGYCVNRLGFAYRGYSFKKRKFPSGVFLIKHAKGNVLFDSGYSTKIYDTGLKGWLYRKLNPTFISKNDEIINQLKRDGIKANDISYIIVSHLHPDHIGGLKYFPKSKIIISKDTFKTLRSPTFSDLIFSSLLPKHFDSQVEELETMGLAKRSVKSLNGYDLFGDGSIIICNLDGHTHGHLGALIAGKIILAGDASWGEDLLEASKSMRLPVQLIHSNQANYLETLNLLQKLRKKGIKLCFSHDIYSDKELLSEK